MSVATSPIFWTPRSGGISVFRGHGAVHRASRDTETLSNRYMSIVQMQTMQASLPPGTQRVPEFRIDPAHPPTFHGGNVIGVDSLHLVWEG